MSVAAWPLAMLVGALALVPVAVGLREWREVHSVQDAVGQPHYTFGASVASSDVGVVAVGSPSANAAKGVIRVIQDPGGGYTETARLRNPVLLPLDALGASVDINPDGTEIIAGAPGDAEAVEREGSVFVFRANASYRPDLPGGGRANAVDMMDKYVTAEAGDPAWVLHERLRLPKELLKESFGRQVALRGDVLVVSSISLQTPYSRRDTVQVMNAAGSRDFYEAYSGESYKHDNVHIFNRKIARDDVARFIAGQRLQPAVPPKGRDFGYRISLDDTARYLAVASPVRFDALYGHGTDDHLVVEGIVTLDGSGEFNYKSITVKKGGVLTVTKRDPRTTKGGKLIIRVQGTFLVEPGGLVNVSTLGYKGGPASFTDGGLDRAAAQGESPTGKGTLSSSSNGGGGGAAVSDLVGFKSCNYINPQGTTNGTKYAEACGGGGGHGSPGEPGTSVLCGTSGSGGEIYGDPLLDTIHFGSGGGSGHPYKFGSGGAGGDGGGIIDIRARRFINQGRIEANGGVGQNGGYFSGGGGGGAGGSIRLQGEEFNNTGEIYAVGGAGGYRAVGSGSDGDPSVKGGDGGYGRIRLAFLTVAEIGTIVPAPTSIATYDGYIHVFERLPNPQPEGTWVEVAEVRPEKAYFIGHSVAIDGEFLAFGSDQLTIDPAASVAEVYIYRHNGTTWTFHQLIEAPNTTRSVHFGHALLWSNSSLFISSLGSDSFHGVVWLYRKVDDADGTPKWVLADTLLSQNPAPGDSFGLAVAHSPAETHETMYVLSNQADFVGSPVKAQKPTTRGGLHVFQHELGIATATLECEHTKLTARTTTKCTIRTYDVQGKPVGYHLDVANLTVNVSIDHSPISLDPVREGEYEFWVTPHAPGEVVLDNGLKSLTLTVLPPIDPFATTFTCNESATAGETVVCSITSAVGELSAVPYFSATIVNTDEYAEYPPHYSFTRLPHFGRVHRYITGSSIGIPPHPLDEAIFRQFTFPNWIAHEPLRWVEPGRFELRFPTTLEGMHSILLKYQGIALQSADSAPNPALIHVEPPTIAAGSSGLLCEPAMPPNRTTACTIFLRGASSVRSGWEEVVGNLTTTFKADGVDVSIEHYYLWGGIGKIRLWLLPSLSDTTLSISVTYNNEPVPPLTPFTGEVAISTTDPVSTCQDNPHLSATLGTLKSHFFSRNDFRVHGDSATLVIPRPSDFCEANKL